MTDTQLNKLRHIIQCEIELGIMLRKGMRVYKAEEDLKVFWQDFRDSFNDLKWIHVLSMTVNCLTQLHNLALLMFEFFSASVFPMLASVLHNVLTAAAGALVAWAIGKLRTSFAWSI